MTPDAQNSEAEPAHRRASCARRLCQCFALVISVALAVVLAGCATPGTSAGPAGPVVLAEAQGICPTHIVYVPMPDACKFAHEWNAGTHFFATPHRLWGVAYAFNCGSRPGEFSFDERLPAMDHMAVPGRYLHAKQGSGYLMISKRTMTDLLKQVPKEFTGDGDLTEVDIVSACTWHVKAILGTQQDLAAAVPRVPTVARKWWEKRSSHSSA